MFALNPDKLANIQALLVRISKFDNHALTSNNTYIRFTFMIPFVRNNFALSYSNNIIEPNKKHKR